MLFCCRDLQDCITEAVSRQSGGWRFTEQQCRNDYSCTDRQHWRQG